LEFSSHESPDAVDLGVGNSREVAVEADDGDDTWAAEDPQSDRPIEPGEAVSWKQGPGDLLLPILPSAPTSDGGQKRLDFASVEVTDDTVFVT
jgi:hypothetical protein